MALNLMTLTATERNLVVDFATQGNDGKPTDAGILLVLDFLHDGTLEFGLVGTPDEHLHVAHPVTEHATWCTTCDKIVNKKGNN